MGVNASQLSISFPGSSHFRSALLGVLLGCIIVYSYFTVSQSASAASLMGNLPSVNLSSMSYYLNQLRNQPGNTTETSPSTQPQCKAPVHNVYYVKVHKTASSTLVTLLYGLARHHNLTVYPVTRDPYPDPRGITSYQFKAPREHNNTVYNIFGEHYIFHSSVAEKLMLRDTKYIATIRYPVSHLRSIFVEFNIAGTLGIRSADPIEEFLADPGRYSKNIAVTS